MEMKDTLRIRPSVCFEVQKVIGVSIGNGNVKTYQVQWAPAWISGFHLVGCEHLIEEFLTEQQSEKCPFVDSTPMNVMTDANDLENDTREDVLSDDDVPGSQIDIHERLSDSNSREHPSTEVILIRTSMVVNESENVMVTSTEANASNEKVFTHEMHRSDRTNPIFELVTMEDIDDNEHTQKGDRALFAGEDEKPHPLVSENEFQNNVLEIEKEEIMLEEETETDQDSLNKDYGNTSNSTENTLIHPGEMPWLLNKRRLMLHTCQTPYQCNVCNKAFPQKDILEKHLMLHTAEKPYICVECNKSFKQKTSLIDHFRLHSGDKPFKCMECNRSFARKHHLTTHLRIHTGEKPYRCSQCHKAFSDQSNLRQHLQSCKHMKT